jgi:hypothetical protein
MRLLIVSDTVKHNDNALSAELLLNSIQAVSSFCVFLVVAFWALLVDALDSSCCTITMYLRAFRKACASSRCLKPEKISILWNVVKARHDRRS